MSTHQDAPRAGLRAAAPNLDSSDIERRARAAQARHVIAGLAAAGRAVTGGVRGTIAFALCRVERRALLRELGALDDDLLADIGLERMMLRQAVDAALPLPPLPFFGTVLPRLGMRLGGWIAARRRRTAIEGELYGLDDRALADIGIVRNDIPAIVSDAAGFDHPARSRRAA